MRKGILLLVLATFGCSSTKYTVYTSWPKFLSNESILVSQVAGVSENVSFELYESALQQLKTENNKILYLPEYEYDLIAAGIGKGKIQKLGSSDSLSSLIARQLNVEYLLDVQLVGLSSKGGSFGTYSDVELSRENSHYIQGNESRSASLLFNFIDLNNHTVRKFIVETNINPLSIEESDGGETRINLASQVTAMKSAYEKAIKKMKKGMIEKGS